MRKRQKLYVKQLDELLQFSELPVKTEVCGELRTIHFGCVIYAMLKRGYFVLFFVCRSSKFYVIIS